MTQPTPGVLDDLRITLEPPPEARDLAAVHNKVIDLAQAKLGSDATRALIADAVESRAEGLLSRGECERIAGGIAAVLSGSHALPPRRLSDADIDAAIEVVNQQHYQVEVPATGARQCACGEGAGQPSEYDTERHLVRALLVAVSDLTSAPAWVSKSCTCRHSPDPFSGPEQHAPGCDFRTSDTVTPRVFFDSKGHLLVDLQRREAVCPLCEGPVPLSLGQVSFVRWEGRRALAHSACAHVPETYRWRPLSQYFDDLIKGGNQ